MGNQVMTAYLRGCERVTGIVSRNAAFRAIIEPDVPKELRAIAAEIQYERRADAFINHLRKRTAKIRHYDVERADMLMFGKTRNNRREFDFLLDLLRENGIAASSRLFLDDFKSARVARSKETEAILERILPQARDFVARQDLGPAQLWQLFQFTATFINIRVSFPREDQLPRAGVVANDHSPAQAAFKAAMDDLSIPVIYVQHAEVSTAFPPLDFAVSILRNRISLDIYRKIAPVKGDAFILSRNREGNRLAQVAGESVKAGKRALVGIYPTSRFDAPTIGRLLQRLEFNPAVEDYFVKLHPNSATTLSDEQQSRYRVRTDIPTDTHVAVVGNSSVTTELLSSGIPVYQLFELDEVERDYYGFVAAGLTKEIKADQLASDAFWNDGFFDRAWLSVAAKFEPAIDSDQDKERARVARHLAKRVLYVSLATSSALTKQMGRMLRAAGRRAPSPVEALARAAAEAVPARYRNFELVDRNAVRAVEPTPVGPAPEKSPPQPRKIDHREASAQQWIAATLDQATDRLRLADALLSTATDGRIRSDIIAWFQARWADRDDRAFDLVRNASAEPLPSDPWLRALPHDLMAMPLTSHAAGRLVEDIAVVDHPPARRTYELIVMRILLKNGYIDEFRRLVDASPVYRLGTLGANFKVELTRFFAGRDDPNSVALLKELMEGLSDYERTKIQAAGAMRTGEVHSHEVLEQKFLAMMTPALAQQFADTVLPAYESMRPRMRYMDIRTTESQRLALRERILKALDDQQPFALVRLGDGEAYLFDENVGPFTEADRQMRERHWWNIALPDETRALLRSKSLAAVREADVLGVPSIHRFFRDYSPKADQLLPSTATRGIVTSVLGAAKLGVDADFTEDRAHHIVFDRLWLEHLIGRARRVVVVSSVRETQVREHLAKLATDIKVIEIPTHAKTKINPMFVDWDEPLPLALERIEDRLGMCVQKGDLVLVSAGVAGKSFIGLAKRAGAVGLDLGGQIEPLVGVPGSAIF